MSLSQSTPLISSIPTTNLCPILLGDESNNGGGIEYKGRLYMSQNKALLMGAETKQDDPLQFKNIPPRYSSQELWFMAKLYEKKNNDNEKDETVPFLAKVWSTKNEIGCTYDRALETLLSDAEGYLYCL